MTEKEKDIGPAQMRSFGLIAGTLFLGIAFWPVLFHGDDKRLWAVIVSGLLVLLAVVLPASLRPIYKAWMHIASALAWVNTRIIMSIGFYGIITPIGIVMRLVSKDPLRRGFDPHAATYRVNRSPRPASHMQKPF
jgi:hypothetical protein